MKKILTLLIGVAVLTACNKYIDIDEKGKVIPKTVNDYYQLLSDYNVMKVSSINVFYLNDEIKIYKDEVSRIFFGPDVFANGYLWKDYIYNNADDNDKDWNTYYAQIYICNMVIDKIDVATGNNEVLRKTAKGEALAQRAFAYFMLANLYAKHYNTASYITDLAVPLYLQPDINAKKARATVKEVYEQVEKDLLTALDLVPLKSTFSYHPSKAAVQGLLAKMYLFQGKYEQAKSYADLALQANSFLYDFKDYDFTPGLPKFLGLANFPTRAIDNKEIIWDKQNDLPFVYMIAVYMSDAHRALYDAGDRRLYFADVEGGPFGPNVHGNSLFGKDRIYKSGITTPDLLLIRAECNARLSKPDLAVDDLNTLRLKRFDANKYQAYPKNKTDLEALQLVLKERRLELMQDGWRWFDLKRLNLDPRFKQTLNRDWGGQAYTLKPEDNNYVLAIPKKVVELNNLMIQNPRDNKQ
uniref:RagB/SusD family nutrient uptake outer membrane protein n=1 Tax=Pedobacter schmidteae TaxID=2201271 RepID=UPI000EAD0CDA|nr:RagB/SusD family nutrient uptake outer membrane protein [Pedobacter schmidteae]